MEEPQFRGRFTNVYTVDEEAYRQKKKDFLIKRAEERDNANLKQYKTDVFRDRIILKLKGEGLDTSEIVEKLEKEYNYSIGVRMIEVIS